MNEEKEKILNAALDNFMKAGFYKTSMDIIAADLRISKKTIYKHYNTKDEIVKDVAFLFINMNKKVIENVIMGDGNAVHKLHKLIEVLSKIVLKVSERFLIDLQTQKPKIWLSVDKFRTEIMTANLGKIIAQGQNEKLIKDYPVQLIINAFISTVRGITNKEFLLSINFSAAEAVSKSIELLMNGILTEKGTKYFNQEKNNAV